MADKNLVLKRWGVKIAGVALSLIAVLFFSPTSFAEDAGKIPITGHSIVVNRDMKGWIGVAPEKENSAAVSNGEYIWKDASGDDTGNGRYTYPLERNLKKGADLKEFRVTYDKDNVYFLIRTDSPADWWTGYKIIGIHKEGVPGGAEVVIQGDKDEPNFDSGTLVNLRVSPALACHYFVAISSTYKGRIWDGNGKLIARRDSQPEDTAGFKIDDDNWEVIQVAIPLKLIGGDPSGQEWKIIVATGQQDSDLARRVESKQSQLHGGGGDDNGENPNVYDLAGSDKTTQEKELGSYNPKARAGDPSGFATIDKSFLTVTFGTR